MARIAPHMPSESGPERFRGLSQRGFRDVSVDDIADFAGVSKGCFYTHYKSKQETCSRPAATTTAATSSGSSRKSPS